MNEIYNTFLTDKEWRMVIDRYLTEGSMHPEDYERMTDYQKYTIQTLKKAFKRLRNKYEEENTTNTKGDW